MIGGVVKIVLVDRVMLTCGSDEPDRTLRLGQKPTTSKDRELFLTSVVQIMIGEPKPGALQNKVKVMPATRSIEALTSRYAFDPEVRCIDMNAAVHCVRSEPDEQFD